MATFDSFNTLYMQKYRGKPFIDDDDEGTLICELMKISGNSNELDYSHRNLNANIFLINLHELMQITDGNLLRTCIEILAKAVDNEHNRLHLVEKMNFLPLLSNILASKQKRDIRHLVLKLIDSLCSQHAIKFTESYISTLMQTLASFVADYNDEDSGKLALAIMLNICHNNAFALHVLKEKVDLELLRKKITLEHYGILACKMVALLSNIGQKMNDAEIKNFFRFFNSQIPMTIQNFDTISIGHATSFFESLSVTELSKETIGSYSFKPIVDAIEAFLTDPPSMETSEKYNVMKYVYGLASIIISTKNKSFHGIFATLIASAIDFIQIQNSSREAIRLCHTIFETMLGEKKRIESTFDLKSLTQNIRKVLTHSTTCPTTLIAALKLITFMQTEYNVSILTESYVESILEPLKGKEIKYTELHTDVVTMYLQCLSIASELLQPEQSAAFFEATNIHYLIGMAIKFGDKEQLQLALDCVQRQKMPVKYLAEIAVNVKRDQTDAAKSQPSDFYSHVPMLASTTLLSPTSHTLANSNALNTTAINNVTAALKSIDKANKENRLHQQNLSDFMKVFNAQILLQKQKNEAQKNHINDLMRRITTLTQTESVNMNSIESLIELSTSLQSTVEKLQSEIVVKQNDVDKYKALVQSTMDQNIELKNDLKRKCDAIKLKENRVAELEKEIEMDEDTRNKIIHLMAKRKK